MTEVTETLPDGHRLPDLAAQYGQPAARRAAVESVSRVTHRRPGRRPRAQRVSLTGARLAFGDRVLWDHLDLSVSRRRVHRGAGSQRHRQDLAAQGAARTAPAERRRRAGRRQTHHLGQRTHRLCAATSSDRPRRDAARARPGRGWASTGHRWGCGVAARRRPGPPARGRAAGAATGQRRTAGRCPRRADVRRRVAAGARSRRHWPATRCCCCATNRY